MPRLVVVGAGVFGAALAYWTAGLGWDVVLVEQATGGHPRAASTAESRIYRCGHGPHLLYTRLARRAGLLWRELERESGRRLLLTPGLAWFAATAEGWAADTERTLRAEGIPVERVAGADVYPSFRDDDLALVLLEPEGGALLAGAATATLVEQALRRGARVVNGRARPDADMVAVTGPSGDELLDGDHVVWACGGWLPDLFPELPLRVSRQHTVYLAVPPPWAAERVPAWIDYEAPLYSVGSVDGGGLKVGVDHDGPDSHPEAPATPPPPEAVDLVRGYVGRRFPALRSAPVRATAVCQYVLTPDTHFLVDRLPGHRSWWVLGGDSGHGFKHAPALAERLAAMLAGTAPVEPAWRLAERAPGPGLRTRGGRTGGTEPPP